MTMKQRAVQYANHVTCFSKHERWYEAKEDYIEAATEQREIDIEKAWRIYNMPVCGSWTKESFTKAMKGE